MGAGILGQAKAFFKSIAALRLKKITMDCAKRPSIFYQLIQSWYLEP